jgi:hypothetical protein
MARRA